MKFAPWLLLLLALPAAAAISTTTISQTVKSPDGVPLSGTAVIRLSDACNSGGELVGALPITVKFTAGDFHVALAANDTCLPAGTSYTATFSVPGRQWTDTWKVRTSATPLAVTDVIVDSVPALIQQISITQIDSSATGNGCVMSHNGTLSAISCAPLTLGKTWRQLTLVAWKTWR